MNFDTYKIKDELLEIYSGSEETFCVGKILSQNRDSILFRSYDAQGKNDGLHFIKSSHISEIKSNTQYLRKMQLYLAYWREQEDAPLTNPFKKHPALSGLLAYAMENKKIITVFCSSKPDELLTGYVETYDNKKIKLNCVDMETACIYETATLLKEDIFYLEVDSLDNELLKYANEKIERLLSGVAGAVGHNIIELSVWLGVQLVKYHRVDVEAMLGVCLCGKYLIEAPQWLID